MKKFITALAVLLMCLLAVPTSTVDAAAKINKSKVTVYVGQSTTLKVSGTKKKANWKTSNNKVATAKNGKVTAKKSGTAVITAKVGSKKYTCKVTVKNPSEKTVVMKVDKEVINDKEVASITNTYLKQLTIKSKKTTGCSEKSCCK